MLLCSAVAKYFKAIRQYHKGRHHFEVSVESWGCNTQLGRSDPGTAAA